MKKDIGINARPIITKRRKPGKGSGKVKTRPGTKLVTYTGKLGGQHGWANPEGRNDTQK